MIENPPTQEPESGMLDIMDQGVSIVGELARSRRAKVEEEVARPQPSFIEGVEHSEVIYYFRNPFLPYEEFDPSLFIQRISQEYGSDFQPVNFSALLKTMPREEILKLEEHELLRRLTRSRDAQLEFRGGRFPLRNDFVLIRSIFVKCESILVRVAGVSSVAEQIVSEIAELMWLCAGVTKGWPEIAKGLFVTGYATVTRVTLDFPLENLTNPKLLAFLQGNLVGGLAYAREAGRQYPKRTDKLKVNAVATLDKLYFKVNKFDLTTGFTETVPVEIDITAKSDYGLGQFIFSTGLSYDRHVEFLAALVEAVRPSPVSGD